MSCSRLLRVPSGTRSSVLESRTPALVWFYSGSDCPSCESLASVLETAAEKLTAWGMHVGAVDVDGQGKLAKEIGLAKSMFAINVSETGSR